MTPADLATIAKALHALRAAAEYRDGGHSAAAMEEEHEARALLYPILHNAGVELEDFPDARAQARLEQQRQRIVEQIESGFGQLQELQP